MNLQQMKRSSQCLVWSGERPRREQRSSSLMTEYDLPTRTSTLSLSLSARGEREGGREGGSEGVRGGDGREGGRERGREGGRG